MSAPTFNELLHAANSAYLNHDYAFAACFVTILCRLEGRPVESKETALNTPTDHV